MHSDKVVRQALRAVERGKPVHINGLVNRLIAGMCTLLPHGMMHRIMPTSALGRKRARLTAKKNANISSGETP